MPMGTAIPSWSQCTEQLPGGTGVHMETEQHLALPHKSLHMQLPIIVPRSKWAQACGSPAGSGLAPQL